MDEEPSSIGTLKGEDAKLDEILTNELQFPPT